MRDLSDLEIEQTLSSVAKTADEFLLDYTNEVLNVRMPDTLREFFRYSNGGELSVRFFDHDDGDGGSSVNEFYYLSSNINDKGSVIYNTLVDRSNLIEVFQYSDSDSVISLANNGGGDTIFINCKTENIFIMYFDPYKIRKISNSFESFIDVLYFYDE